VEDMTLTPMSKAPNLFLPLTTGGSTDELALGAGVDGRFTLVLFFRGLHCPVVSRVSRNCPVAVMKTARWWPWDLPSVGHQRSLVRCAASRSP